MRTTLFVCLAATAAALRRTGPSFTLRASQTDPERARRLSLQHSWNTGGPQQWDASAQQQQQQQQGFPPQQQQQQQGYGAQVRWHLTPAAGVLSGSTLCNGEEMVLGRFDMAEQKLTVSRAQCIVRVAPDGTAVVESLGKRPTGLRRHGNAPWYGISQGYHTLVDGEQIALDMDSGESFGWQGHPYTAIFTAVREGGDMGMEYEQGRSQLPYPWVQLADPNGRIYYSNQQTGVSTWDPRVPYYPQQGYESV